MLTFFRDIRKSILNLGQPRKPASPARPNGWLSGTGRYILYAIGEIVLVVIGILIALQINNWNEWRKDRVMEYKLIEDLRDNLKQNYDYLEGRKSLLQKTTEKSGLYLLDLTGKGSTTISADSLLTHIVKTFIAPHYSPSIATFNRILNNEEFNLIQYDSLKTLLNQYNSILELTYHTNDMLIADEDALWAYAEKSFGGLSFGQKFSDKESFLITVLNNLTERRPSFHPDEILSDTQFETLLTRRMLNYNWAKIRIEDFQQCGVHILDFMEDHYSF